METITINYWAVLVCGIFAMALGQSGTARFLIQGGYQLMLFIVFGLFIHYWK